MNDDVKTLRVHAYGERNYPVAQVLIPETLVQYYAETLADARRQYPAYSDSDLIRYIFQQGLLRVRDTARLQRLPDPNRTQQTAQKPVQG